MNVGRLGSFIRDQRTRGRLSLRNVAGLSGVSVPYLSQVERGLRKPSADILQGIAKGLRISAETLYVQAGMLEDRPQPDVVSALMSDESITETQRQALVQIYVAFRDDTVRAREQVDADFHSRPAARKTRGSATSRPRTSASRKPSAPNRGGGAELEVDPIPHPAPLRPSAVKPRVQARATSGKEV